MTSRLSVINRVLRGSVSYDTLAASLAPVDPYHAATVLAWTYDGLGLAHIGVKPR